MVRAKKFLGQHFLKNPAIAQRIAGALEAGPESLVLEIGPGTGVLTRFLIKRYQRLHVVELDRESVAYLKQQEVLPAAQIQERDFLQMDLAGEFAAPIAIIGNFPYNFSSQIFFKVLSYNFTEIYVNVYILIKILDLEWHFYLVIFEFY